jgi:hypothetical protein
MIGGVTTSQNWKEKTPLVNVYKNKCKVGVLKTNYD